MEISAKILADSVSAIDDTRITSLELHYHRYVLPEFNTHRAFSRNGASSRAIPTEKLVANCLREMVEPLEWGLDQSGMQAFTHADDQLEAEGRRIWNEARSDAIRHALKLHSLGFAKQIVNRVIEPFLSTRTVLTATDWANWEGLRNHKDAQPEIRDLAQAVIEARLHSTPKVLNLYDWHTPYILDEDNMRLRTCETDWAAEGLSAVGIGHNSRSAYFDTTLDAVKCIVSAARCARVSYRTHEGKPTDFKEDGKLFNRLAISAPVHASPTEHQATPSEQSGKHLMTRNFRSWVQFRALVADDTIWDR
ncbi:FAD-dependent thymidylate synthase [Pseudaminobacter sp. 19-2017]|uniref:FAD-dependent thymidylate synthase n=1 Tax=Pseudaminobacter soli (ex Zhang et al. 2022) TaxID=2831468 RepID=A0A942DX10_9HYPH|nr:FAD-dependent thymidylate synthase [Pseudaminobacter soli]MBS3648718.1 FAD-dependent thymidylate synthase [Pseudaminobacter soli]